MIELLEARRLLASLQLLLPDVGDLRTPFSDTLTGLRGKAYFTRVVRHVRQLWSTDGTPEGTAPFAQSTGVDIGANPIALTPSGGRLYLAVENGARIRVTDGTPAGTKSLPPKLQPLNFDYYYAPSADERPLFAVGDTVFAQLTDTPSGTQTLVQSRTDGVFRTIRQFHAVGYEGAAHLLPNELVASGGVVFDVGRGNRFHIVAPDSNPSYSDDGPYDATPSWYNHIEMSATVNGRAYWRVIKDYGPHTWWSMNTNGRNPKALEVLSGVDRAPVSFAGAAWFVGARGLYRSDGTPTGTTQPVSFTDAPDSGPFNLTVFNGRLYFDRGGELWSSDGTQAGTTRLAEFDELQSAVVATDNAIYFIATDAAHGREIRSFTPGVGFEVIESSPGPGALPLGSLDAVEGKVYAWAKNAANSRSFDLYRVREGANTRPIAVASVPTSAPEGTPIVLDASGSSDPDGDPIRFRWDLNGDGFFTDVVTTSKRITVTPEQLVQLGLGDGPREFQVRLQVVDLAGRSTSAPFTLGILNVAPSTKITIPPQIVQQTDAPVRVRVFDPGIESIAESYIDWGDGRQTALESRDSTVSHRYAAAGRFNVTVRIRDDDGSHIAGEATTVVVEKLSGWVNVAPRLGHFYVLDDKSFAQTNGRLVFTASSARHIAVIYSTPLHGYGQEMLAGGYQATSIVSTGDWATMVVQNVGGSVKEELWRTDGTPAGTRKLMEYSGVPGHVYRLGDRVLFRSYAQGSVGQVLWHTDVNGNGASPVTLDSGERVTPTSGLVEYRGQLFFVADRLDRKAGRSLYAYDGEVAREIHRIYRGTGRVKLKLLGDRLYIERSGYSADTRPEVTLYQSDGTSAGTHGVAAVGAGDKVTYTALLGVGEGLFAVASIEDDDRGEELWRVDEHGVARIVRDINAGPKSSRVRLLGELAGNVYFLADDGTHGLELWRSDGTADGTRMVIDLNPGAAGTRVADVVTAGGLLYLSAYRESTYHPILYRTDGTAEGTLRMPMTPGAFVVSGSVQSQNNRVVFLQRPSGSDVAGQWWVTRGSRASTRLLGATGPQPTNPSEVRATVSGQVIDALYLGDGRVIGDLWQYHEG